MFYLITIQKFIDGSEDAKNMLGYETDQAVKTAFYNTIASCYANSNIGKFIVKIIDDKMITNPEFDKMVTLDGFVEATPNKYYKATVQTLKSGEMPASFYDYDTFERAQSASFIDQGYALADESNVTYFGSIIFDSNNVKMAVASFRNPFFPSENIKTQEEV